MSNGNPSARTPYRMACALAIVSCAFSLLVGMLMISNAMAVRMASPLDLPELDRLRQTLKASPADEAVREKIRDLDQVARRLYFKGISSSRTGALLLLGGVAVSLLSLKLVARLRRRLPDPSRYPATPDILRTERLARFSLGGMAGVALLAALIAGGLGSGESGSPRSKPVQEPSAGQVAPGDGSVPVWPSFRGASGSGVAAQANPPTTWDGATGSGIVWKAEVPLAGLSSPVVAGNKVYLTGATGEKREVYCFDLATGTRLWSVEAKGGSLQPKKVPEIFQDTGYAAPTPVTDGLRVISIFANGDVIAVDHCAQVLWTVDLGLPVNRYGHSASLASFGGRVLVQYDQDSGKGSPSRLIALDEATGRTVWSTPRAVSDSWPSPVVVETDKGPQLVTVANERIIAYDPATGRELWSVRCSGTDAASSPIAAGGLVIASIAADRVYAIRPDGTGDVTETHVAWTSGEGVSDVPSPVSNGELVFLVNSSGHLACLEVKTGAKVWEQDLEGEFYGSPGLAGDTLYLVARNGTVFILRAGRQYEVIGKASLGEPSEGSPVFAGDRILIRGIKTLFCIGNKAK